jgi:hypothetical protein
MKSIAYIARTILVTLAPRAVKRVDALTAIVS